MTLETCIVEIESDHPEIRPFLSDFAFAKITEALRGSGFLDHKNRCVGNFREDFIAPLSPNPNGKYTSKYVFIRI